MSLDTAKAIVTLNRLTQTFDATVKAGTPWYPNVCTVVNSTRKLEDYAGLGSMPGVREWLGDRVFHELRGASFQIENKHWEDSLSIKKTDINDDSMGLYPSFVEALGAEAVNHPDELFFQTLLAGETNACFDGQYFFDTDHSWGDSGTQSNLLTYNAADHTAVTVAEMKAAYHSARKTMVKYKNDNGKFLNRPTIGQQSSLTLLVPPELSVQAEEMVASTIISNSTNVVLDRPKVVETPFLTAATDMYLFNLRGPLKPMVFQAREPITRQMKGMDDKETKDVKFMTEARYNVGYLAWWTAILIRFN